MRSDPPNVRIIKPVEPRTGNPMTDAEGYVLLSDRDVDRIAQRVKDLLQQVEQKAAPLDDPYIPVHRNEPRRPMTEY